MLQSMGLQRVGHDSGTAQQQIRGGRGCRAWEEQPRNSTEARGQGSGSRSRDTQNTFEFFTELKTPSKWKSESESRLVVSDSLQPHGLYSPWNSPGQNTGVGSHSLHQGTFPIQGSNPVSCIAGEFFTS